MGSEMCIRDRSYAISALFKPSRLGDFKQVIVFEFEDESTAKTYHIARFLTGQGTSQDVEDILPTEKYQHPKPIARVVDPKVSVIRGVPPPRFVFFLISIILIIILFFI